VPRGSVVRFIAALIYVAITVGQRLPAYIAAHFLILGGMAGGLVMASRRRQHERAS
jgi:hypothetical protein